jgi:membrane protein implicated in regulation of membrane protease activity
METWVFWLIAAVFAAVGEILTTGFFLAPFALGAVVAALADLAGLPGEVQAVAFVAATAAGFALVRPIARRHLHTPAQIRTGTAALVGRPATVVQRIANDESVGQIRLDGDVWTARSYIDDEVLPVGTKVHVVAIRGATALVAE